MFAGKTSRQLIALGNLHSIKKSLPACRYPSSGDPAAVRPSEVLMLDFGTSCYLHPGFDLSLFFLTSTTPELRRSHLDALLRRYHSTLLRVVGECSGGREDLKDYYKFEDLMDDYR